MMRRALTIVGVILVVLVVLIGGAFGVVVAQSNAKLATEYDVPEVADIEIPTGAEAFEEGERLYITRGCADCHTENGGGQIFIDDPAMGRVIVPNLTSGEGGIVDKYQSSGDWVRALRHGVDVDGTAFLIMPSHHFNHYSDTDLGLIIGYIEQLEPVDNVLPDEQRLGPIGRMLTLAENTNELLPAVLIDHDNIDVWNDVEVDATEEYGHYLVRGGCIGCHSENLSGGPNPAFEFIPSNITTDESGIGGWTLEEFSTAMRNGIRPDDSVIDPSMPWNIYSQLTDTEIEAIYLYIQSVDALPYDTDVTEENSLLNR